MKTITMFSQNDVNDINHVLSDENFERVEIYDVINALEKYEEYLKKEKYSQKRIIELKITREKFERIALVDLENEK